MTTEEAMLENGIPANIVKKILAYWDSDKNNKAVWQLNDGAARVKLATKFWNLGIPLDGLNAAITGKNKVFITWVGYKNKVLSLYPEAQFDVQLIRDGDKYEFSKDSGKVIYTHQLADPFAENASPAIKGAYAVLKYSRGEVLETLDVKTYNQMKSSSMLKSSWEAWESEFWLKSVIKRVCKRAFHDEFEEIEKVDNEDYDMNQTGKVKVTRKAAEKNAIKEAMSFLQEAESLDQLQLNWSKISREAQMNPEVVKLKNDLKVAMMEEPEA